MSVDLPVPDHEADEARRAIRSVLAGPDFADDRTLLRRGWDWVMERLAELIGDLLGNGDGGLGSVWAARAVAVVFAAAALFFLLRLARGLRRDHKIAVGEDEVGRPAVDWRAEAAAREEAGQWREAIRCRYRSVIADLAADGVVDEVPGRTTGIYRRLVERNRPEAMAGFGPLTDLFERIWYGGETASSDDAASARHLAARAAGRLTSSGRR